METQTNQEPSTSTETDNLNKLLEDALDDLLLDDNSPDAEEKEGRPNIQESLKKITELNKKQEGEKKKPKAYGSSSSNVKSTTPISGAGPGVVDIDEMNRFFASMTEQLQAEMPQIDASEAQARLNESVPQIFEMMQTLLSKELLYKALVELLPKFEDWLEKNLATLSKDDGRRYKKQMSKIREIIDVFDDNSLGDQQKFERNLELMEEMQSLGAPPEELTVPDGMSKCSII